MLTRVEYDAQMQEYFSLVAKKAMLEAEKDERNSPRTTGIEN